MTNWINTDYEYEPRVARFFLSSRLMVAIAKLDLRGLVGSEEPDVIEKIVYDMIEELRPDLSGCILYQIKYSIHPMRWEFTIFHRSLKPVAMAWNPPLLPLVPEPGVIYDSTPDPVEQPTEPNS